MSYRYREIPNYLEVVWIKLIRPYNGNHSMKFPINLKVGDITWVRKTMLKDSKYFHIELNKYMGNFEKEYFEVIENYTPDTQNIELNYEIY